MNTNVTKEKQLKERIVEPMNGYLALMLAVFFIVAGLVSIFAFSVLVGVLLIIAAIVLFSGICIVNPNDSAVLQFFGTYYGTVYQNGLFFVNPLTSSTKVSLKRQNFSSEKVRTNDKRGNPIDLGVIVAWKIGNSTLAHYNVEGDLNNFIKEQVLGIFSEEAPKFYFDVNDRDEKNHGEIVFRRNASQIAERLKVVLSQRVAVVGIQILDLNFNHCSYAKEIAQAMLQKQQAEALLDARKTIVDGAYGMVQDLIEKFEEDKKIVMTKEDISSLARNMMLVLVSEKEVTPTIDLR